MEETFGKRIMCHRKRLHLTQDQLAEKMGVTAQAVSKWENDQSCPDINMLPKLAELFGTTTDDLLGHQQVYNTEVVHDEDTTEDGKKGGWDFQYTGKRSGSIALSLFVLLVGMLFLSDRLLDWDVGFWNICWPSALLIFGIFHLCHRFNFTSIACTLLGCYFLVDHLGFVELDFSSELIFPALILVFGLCLLCDAIKKPKKPIIHFHENKGNHETRHDFSQDDESFRCSLSFGEREQPVTLPRLSAGRASVSFGELTVDLTGCQDIVDGCTIEASCSFGQMNLKVPHWCRVQAENGVSFGTIESQHHPDENPRAVIRLVGGVSFGEIDVIYV